jgi:hypothetical protein
MFNFKILEQIQNCKIFKEISMLKEMSVKEMTIIVGGENPTHCAFNGQVCVELKPWKVNIKDGITGGPELTINPPQPSRSVKIKNQILKIEKHRKTYDHSSSRPYNV